MSRRITGKLRDSAETARRLHGPIKMTAEELDRIADEIDAEHELRMYRCAYEVRRKLCKDIRWAVNMFEKGYHDRRAIRMAVEHGGVDKDG